MRERSYRDIQLTFDDGYGGLTYVFFVCGACSALVELPEVHDKWHDGVTGRWFTSTKEENASSGSADH